MKTSLLHKLKNVMAFRSPGYSADLRRDQGRDAVTIERKSEEGLLDNSGRVRVIAQQRDAYRNGTFSPTTALQLKGNVVGADGGKLSVITSDKEFNQKADKLFRRWARHAEFSKGKHFNELLQLLLVNYTHTGGDYVAVFDDGCLTGGNGSGKIKIFESDNIANIPRKEVVSRFGEGYDQNNGVITDKFGRIAGVTVSCVERGAKCFSDMDNVIVLRLKTPADFTDSHWIFCSQDWRVNQLRGVATLTHIVNNIDDLGAILGSEVQATKLNSALGLIIADDSASGDLSAETRGLGLDDYEDGETAGEGDGDGEGAAGGGYPEDEQTTIKGLRESQAAIINVATGKKVESFDTKRPNLNVPALIEKVEGMCASVFGLGKMYVTLEPNQSYSGARAAMKLAEITFSMFKKKLERDFCDWVAGRVLLWAGLTLPEDFDESLQWKWAEMPEIDEGSYQAAIQRQFGNLETNLRTRHGSNWRKFVDQLREEIEYCTHGGSMSVLHPCQVTVAGAIEKGNETNNNETAGETAGENEEKGNEE